MTMQEYWTESLVGGKPEEGDRFDLPGGSFVYRDGMLRQEDVYTETQEQTKDAFAYKWEQRDTYESDHLHRESRQWLVDRYCGEEPGRLDEYAPDGARFLDAGCGAGYSAPLLLGERTNRVRYLGVDISRAVDVARDRFADLGLEGEFLQASFLDLPFDEPVFDAILAEGTLHHTDSTEEALKRLARLLVPGGRFLFYVYREKGPIREFTDDYVREHIAGMSDEEAWEALLPLSRLGKALGDLDAEVEISEDVPYLGIEAGTYDVQRFFYWHVMKVFYRPEMSVEEMNGANFDWFRPLNAHRQTEDEVRAWCEEAGLEIEHLDLQRSGITAVARKRD